MNPAPKTVYSDLLSEIFSVTVKTRSELKIQSWIRKAESLKSVDPFQYKLMLGIIETYKNENEKARSTAEAAILLTQSNAYKAMAYRVIGNSYTHQGDYRKAMDSYWSAYILTLNSDYFYTFFKTGTNYDLYDERMNQMQSLSLSDQNTISKELEGLKDDIQQLNNLNLNPDIYRDILSAAYSVFFSNCCGKITRFPSISDSNISTILYQPNLDLKTVGLLNDEMNDSLVNLLEKYEYDELLKYPIFFSSEDYSNNSIV